MPLAVIAVWELISCLLTSLAWKAPSSPGSSMISHIKAVLMGVNVKVLVAWLGVSSSVEAQPMMHIGLQVTGENGSCAWGEVWDAVGIHCCSCGLCWSYRYSFLSFHSHHKCLDQAFLDLAWRVEVFYLAHWLFLLHCWYCPVAPNLWAEC